MKKTMWHRAAILLVCLAASGVLTVSLVRRQEQNTDQDWIRITAILPHKDYGYWSIMGEGILAGGKEAGFLHMGSRGGACDWLEDVFVREELRGQGIGGRAIELAWEMLREKGLETMYLEVVPANEAAIRLYHKLGFTNLNTLTLNRSVKKKAQLGTETIGGLTFRTYRPNNG